MFDNEIILITGGTGSFGKAFTQKLFENYNPTKVIIYSRDELKQYEMQQEFDRGNLRFLIGDVRDRSRLEVAMKGVDLVIHAAALKQVPSSEYNPMECIKTNIHGAENVVQAAWGAKVKKVIALSTDKAVNPINLYGATKLASDKLFIAANNMVGSPEPRYSVVRYGNVVGSRGSVLPYFHGLIRDGANSLPITHKDMTRFWITLDEGVDFVFKSIQRMGRGEVFIPRAPSIRVVDLVTALDSNLEKKYIGMRPGEKIYETLCPKDDARLTVEFDDHFVIQPAIKFFDYKRDYLTNSLGEKGEPVSVYFEYNSENNTQFLSIEEIRNINHLAGFC